MVNFRCGERGAAARAVQVEQAAQAARPVILEPVYRLQITVPGEYTGDIISDLNGKRAQVQGANPNEDGSTTIEALAPLAEVQRYSTDLRQMTQGQGYFAMEFDHYQPVPAHLTDSIVAAAKAEAEH